MAETGASLAGKSDPSRARRVESVLGFQARLVAGTVRSDVEDVAVLSLAGVVLLAAGFTEDIAHLTQLCTVMRAVAFVVGVV